MRAVPSGQYSDYARAALDEYGRRSPAERRMFFDAVKHLKIENVLDLGCGAGQELFQFLENSAAFCVGIDVAEELGKVTGKVFSQKNFSGKVVFVRARGERLPFADESFNIVLCRLALPYMNNRLAIAEAARVLRSGGVFLLKTHAPPYFLAMLKERLKTLDPKQIAYPLICAAGSVIHLLSGRQPENGFWKGKQVFQTRAFLEREFAKCSLEIKNELSDSNPLSPSYFIVKK
jgi:SAM-dependent methyltransferase